jgi:hypothetical protein
VVRYLNFTLLMGRALCNLSGIRRKLNVRVAPSKSDNDVLTSSVPLEMSPTKPAQYDENLHRMLRKRWQSLHQRHTVLRSQ